MSAIWKKIVHRCGQETSILCYSGQAQVHKVWVSVVLKVVWGKYKNLKSRPAALPSFHIFWLFHTTNKQYTYNIDECSSRSVIFKMFAKFHAIRIAGTMDCSSAKILNIKCQITTLQIQRKTPVQKFEKSMQQKQFLNGILVLETVLLTVLLEYFEIHNYSLLSAPLFKLHLLCTLFLLYRSQHILNWWEVMGPTFQAMLLHTSCIPNMIMDIYSTILTYISPHPVHTSRINPYNVTWELIKSVNWDVRLELFKNWPPRSS